MTELNDGKSEERSPNLSNTTRKTDRWIFWCPSPSCCRVLSNIQTIYRQRSISSVVVVVVVVGRLLIWILYYIWGLRGLIVSAHKLSNISSSNKLKIMILVTFFYKMRRIMLLLSATTFYLFSKKCDRYYKVRQVLQSV